VSIRQASAGNGPPELGRERGVALLIALLVLAIAAGIGGAMLWDRSLAVHRSALLGAQTQAYEYDLGAESWVEQILKRDIGKPDTLGSDWAQQLPPLPVQGGALLGHVEDLEARFNLNTLINSQGKEDTAAFAAFQRLFSALNIDPCLANSVLDWVDPNDIPRPDCGAETNYYGTLDPPYGSANAPFVSSTTLLQIKGITPKIYAALAPYVTALPVATPVNINTAPAPVLAAVVPDLSLAEARSLVDSRGTKGFESVDQFKQLVQKDTPFPLTVNSQFFLLQVTTVIGSTQLTLYSVLYRNDQGLTESIARSFTSI
jgi:general secretion pathway protein K